MSSESSSPAEEAPWWMLYFVDATGLYHKDLVDRCGGKITDVWLFDQRTCTTCCEARPSFEMEYFDSVAYELPEDELEREKTLEDLRISNQAGQEQWKYFLIQGDLRRMTVDAEEYPTTWNYQTTPAVISLDMPDAEAWQEYLNDEDGDVRAAHRKFWEDTREYIQGNCPY